MMLVPVSFINYAFGIALDASGVVSVTDIVSHCIREIQQRWIPRLLNVALQGCRCIQNLLTNCILSIQ